MRQNTPQTLHTMPLGTLGTGAVEIGGDGQFRNITINNNRGEADRIAHSPHSFLAVRAHGAGGSWVRRLQIAGGPESWRDEGVAPGGFSFRRQYPVADCRLREPDAPVEVVWSAFSPVVPYDYEASALPLFYVGVQVTNPGAEALEVSALFNWENLCGRSARRQPPEPVSIRRETLITQADLDRMKQGGPADNERRLSARTGQIDPEPVIDFRALDMPPNALVFGGGEVDANEDGQYCLATPWSATAQTSLRIWDPEDGNEQAGFWGEFRRAGQFEGGALVERGRPGAAAACSRFRLEPGQSRSVEFVLAWYCPRQVVAGVDEGNYYVNNYPDARTVARVGLSNSRYYYAAISAWHQRIAASELGPALTRCLLAGCEVLATNTIHTRSGQFGLFESAADPRVNYLRDRWFWSMGLLLFFPRLEMETLDRISQQMLDESGRHLRISEGIGGFQGGEYVPAGAAQVEACAQLVILAWRNFVFGGSLSFLNRAAPRLQAVLAAVIAQDRDFDGFPDIQFEAPGLDCAFARGLNVITAGLWLVALAAGERIASRLKLPEAVVYRKAVERAIKNYQRYFWNNEHGYYTLYPDARHQKGEPTALQTACHVGQLQAPWMATLLGLDYLFPGEQPRRALQTIETHHFSDAGMRTLSYPAGGGEDTPGWDVADSVQRYNFLRYTCYRLMNDPSWTVPVPPAGESSERHVSSFSFWYLVVSALPARLDLAEKRLVIRPDLRAAGQRSTSTLYTPNGFGAVTVHVGTADVFQCQIDFRMDIPQEIARIEVLLPAALAGVQCRLELEEGPAPVQHHATALGAEVRIEIYPEGKLSVSAFQLQLAGVSGEAMKEASKTPWIPRWLRR